MPALITAVAFSVPPERDGEVLPAYRELVAGPTPEGLLRSELLRGQDGRWHVQTLWRDREAVGAARRAGLPPAALLLAQRFGTDHETALLTVEETLVLT